MYAKSAVGHLHDGVNNTFEKGATVLISLQHKDKEITCLANIFFFSLVFWFFLWFSISMYKCNGSDV